MPIEAADTTPSNASPPGVPIGDGMRRITARWTILVWAGIALHDLWQVAAYLTGQSATLPKPLFEPFHSLVLCTIGITLAVVTLRRSQTRGVILSTIFTWLVVSNFPRSLFNLADALLGPEFLSYASMENRVVLAIAGSLHVLAILWLFLALLEARLALLAARPK